MLLTITFIVRFYGTGLDNGSCETIKSHHRRKWSKKSYCLVFYYYYFNRIIMRRGETVIKILLFLMILQKNRFTSEFRPKIALYLLHLDWCVCVREKEKWQNRRKHHHQKHIKTSFSPIFAMNMDIFVWLCMSLAKVATETVIFATILVLRLHLNDSF